MYAAAVCSYSEIISLFRAFVISGRIYVSNYFSCETKALGLIPFVQLLLIFVAALRF